MTADVRRLAGAVTTIVALALCFVGCQSPAAGSSKEPVLVAGDVFFVGADAGGCTGSTSIVGRLVITDDRRLVLQDDQGVNTMITWRGSFGSRMNGDEVEILDGGTVIARSGGRYRLGGVEGFGGFWACGDVVPEPG